MDLLLDKNLNNLNHFWQALNASEKNGLCIHKSWPNKQWHTNFSLPSSEAAITLSANKVFSTAANMDNELTGFTVKSHLVVMSLALKERSDVQDLARENSANVVKLTNENSANSWATACSLAFGYVIDAEVIKGLLNNANASVLAYMIDGEIAGTAISYRTNDTLGLHQVGTVPNFRKMGVAAALMQYLVAQAQLDEIDYVSLQASQAGLHLYEKMGFQAIGKLTSLLVTKEQQ